MSMSFEIFPTKEKIPKCDEVIKCSVQLFNNFMRKERIAYNFGITVGEVLTDSQIDSTPIYLISNEDSHMTFSLNGEGEVYVFYHEVSGIDKEFWAEELQRNKNAKLIREKISASLEVGYSWHVKKTMGQPAIVGLYYGYLAIAIALLTDGIIYSDDGAWDYSSFPIEGSAFKEEYLDVDKLSDTNIKGNIQKWLEELRNIF